MKLVKRAQEHFKAAEDNLRLARNHERQAKDKIAEAHRFESTYKETIAERKRRYDEAVRSRDAGVRQLEKAIREKKAARAHLVGVYNELNVATSELSANLARGRCSKSDRDAMNNNLRQSRARLAELKASIDNGDRVIGNINANIGEFTQVATEEANTYTQWLRTFEQTSLKTVKSIGQQKDAAIQSLKTSIVQFAARNSSGISDLLAFRGQSDLMEKLAKKFLSTLEGIGDLLCFPEGTLIQTPHGAKAIETFKRGDKVIACDEKSLECRVREVEDLIVTESSVLVELVISGDSILLRPIIPYI